MILFPCIPHIPPNLWSVVTKASSLTSDKYLAGKIQVLLTEWPQLQLKPEKWGCAPGREYLGFTTVTGAWLKQCIRWKGPGLSASWLLSTNPTVSRADPIPQLQWLSWRQSLGCGAWSRMVVLSQRGLCPEQTVTFQPREYSWCPRHSWQSLF